MSVQGLDSQGGINTVFHSWRWRQVGMLQELLRSGTTPMCLPSDYLTSPHATESPKPSPSVFAYCKWSTGVGSGLEMKLRVVCTTEYRLRLSYHMFLHRTAKNKDETDRANGMVTFSIHGWKGLVEVTTSQLAPV